MMFSDPKGLIFVCMGSEHSEMARRFTRKTHGLCAVNENEVALLKCLRDGNRWHKTQNICVVKKRKKENLKNTVNLNLFI